MLSHSAQAAGVVHRARLSRRAAWVWLLRKEWSELVASRSWWVLLVAIGPLVGVSFTNAVGTYAEVSGLGGTAAGVGEALSPLVGVWAPTFSACELASVFLLPFVAIRLVGGDRQSGALKLEAQHWMPAFVRIAAKASVLLLGWLVALLPPLVAIGLWKSYGGATYVPELATVAAGHLLNAGLTIALAAAAASLTENPSTAAIVTLTITVGAWMVDFIAAVQGGVWERLAGYTPTAMVAEFQRGLLRLDLLLVSLTLITTGLALAAIWMRIGIKVQKRLLESLAIAAVGTVTVLASTNAHASWDASENRMNSFSEADEKALRKIQAPLRIEAHLALEDPRRADLERRTLSKLRRVMPDVKVDYVSSTSIGLFEQTREHYGEIWYELDGKKEISRVTTSEGVLESIYAVAGIGPPFENSESVFRGHPLAAPPKGAGIVFYGIWPVAVVFSGILTRRR